MYAGRVACVPLVSHVEYAPRAILRLVKGWDRQTDGRQTDALRLPLDAASVNKSDRYHDRLKSSGVSSHCPTVKSKCSCLGRLIELSILSFSHH